MTTLWPISGTYKLLVFSDKLNKLCDLTVINYIPGSIHIRFVIWQCSLITSGRASGRVIEVCLLVHDIEQVERHTYTKNKKKTRLKRLIVKPTQNWFLELAGLQPSPKIDKSGSIWYRFFLQLPNIARSRNQQMFSIASATIELSNWLKSQFGSAIAFSVNLDGCNICSFASKNVHENM